MDSRTLAQRVAGPISGFDAWCVPDPTTLARSAEAGLSTGWASRTPGRIDAMNDADVDVGLVLQDMMSFDPDHIRANWNQPMSISRVEAALEHAG